MYLALAPLKWHTMFKPSGRATPFLTVTFPKSSTCIIWIFLINDTFDKNMYLFPFPSNLKTEMDVEEL